jgi:hypothetical protein
MAGIPPINRPSRDNKPIEVVSLSIRKVIEEFEFFISHRAESAKLYPTKVQSCPPEISRVWRLRWALSPR